MKDIPGKSLLVGLVVASPLVFASSSALAWGYGYGYGCAPRYGYAAPVYGYRFYRYTYRYSYYRPAYYGYSYRPGVRFYGSQSLWMAWMGIADGDGAGGVAGSPELLSASADYGGRDRRSVFSLKRNSGPSPGQHLLLAGLWSLAKFTLNRTVSGT